MPAKKKTKRPSRGTSRAKPGPAKPTPLPFSMSLFGAPGMELLLQGFLLAAVVLEMNGFETSAEYLDSLVATQPAASKRLRGPAR